KYGLGRSSIWRGMQARESELEAYMISIAGSIILTLLYSGIAVAQNDGQTTDSIVARLSYQNTYGVQWRDQQDSPRICFALYRSGDYRILKLRKQDTETLQGTLSHDELA